MRYTTGFAVGEYVYIKHDPEQSAWMITAVTIRGDMPLYELTSGLTSTSAAEFELSHEEDVAKRLTSQ